MSLSRFCALMLSCAPLVLGGSLALGQEFPSKPIRIIATAAGGGSDFTARLVAQGIAGHLGQPVVVENRGTGVIAGEIVYKSPPDGYTLLVAGSVLWITPLLRKTPFDVLRDFAPISLIEMSPNMVAVHPSMPVKSIKELVALAKAKPGELTYGSPSVAGAAHLATELFKSMAGVDIRHVPYKGIAPALIALLSGEIQLTFGSIASAAPHVQTGRLRALAVTSAERSALVPNLPTIAVTVPGYEAVGVTGIWAPAKTPVAIIDRLNHEIVRFVNRADIKEKFLNAGVETVGNLPEQFAAMIKSDIGKMSKVIKDVGLKLD